MRKVALITIYSITNYGSVLQAYASQRVFERAGIGCEIIDYQYPNAWHYAHGYPRLPLGKQLAIAVATPLLRVFGVPSHHVCLSKLREFRKKHFKFTGPFQDLEALESADWSGYCAVVAGSDQIWNPRFLHGDKAFLLSFVPDGIARLSFASSFASKKIPADMEEHFKRYLSRFDAITVREPNGERIVKEQLGLDNPVETVLDPTLLLSAEEWLETAAPAMGRVPEKPFILLYTLYYAFEPRPYIYEVAREIQKRTGAMIISLGGDADWPSDMKVENRRNASVEEFIALFSKAACVVTSSFHGTAFAVNFGRPLVAVVPEGGADDRQRSLLKALDIEHAAVVKGTPTEKIQPEYDAACAIKKLEELRSRSTNLILSRIPEE